MKSTIICMLCIILLHSANASVYYVKSNGNGVGISWADANRNLQDMIDVALHGDSIFVAAGVYHPSKYPDGCVGCNSPRHWAFLTRSGVKIYGGFSNTDTLFSQRNFVKNQTVVSGDIGLPNDTSDDLHHLFISIGDDTTTLLDGLVLTKAQTDTTTPVKINNESIFPGWGTALLSLKSGINVSNCNFIDNENITIYYYYAKSKIQNCIFEYKGKRYSNGTLLFDSDIKMYNTVFSNMNGFWGSCGMEISSFEITNCTFYNSNFNTNSKPPLIKNSIFWYDKPIAKNIFNLYFFPVPFLTNSINQDSLYPGNQNTDPKFINPTNPRGVDNIWRTADDGLRLDSMSIAIDGSDSTTSYPTFDIIGQKRIGVYDIGAYEYGSNKTNQIEFYSNQTSKVSVFPNPSNDVVYITSPQEGIFIISNIYGQEMRRCHLSVENDFKSSIQGLDNGLYIVSEVGKNSIPLKVEVRK